MSVFIPFHATFPVHPLGELQYIFGTHTLDLVSNDSCIQGQ